MTSDEERMVICEEEGDDDVIGESRLFIYHNHHHFAHVLLDVVKFSILAATCSFMFHWKLQSSSTCSATEIPQQVSNVKKNFVSR